MERSGTTICGGGGGDAIPEPPGDHTDCAVSFAAMVTLRTKGGRYPCGTCSIEEADQRGLARHTSLIVVV
jgi:hypothetical protein